MRQPHRLLLALSALACAGAASAVEIAQPDDALVRRYEQHPDEYAARVRDCDAMGIADAVGSVVCVSTKEVRYRRERAALRTGANASSGTATKAGGAGTQSAALVTRPATVATATETR